MSSQDKNYVIGILASIIFHAIFIALIVLLLLYKHNKAPSETKRELNIGQINPEKPQPATQPTAKEKAPKPTKQKTTKQTKTPKEPLRKDAMREQNRTVSQKPTSNLLSEVNEKFKAARKEAQEEAKQTSGASAGGSIRKLYGGEFERMGKEEQKFIKDNLGTIGKITEKYMYYPSESAKFRQLGEGLYEFYLYPNGDISDLKQVFGTGYRPLDKASKEALELAYKDYPRPSVKTKIRILMGYVP